MTRQPHAIPPARDWQANVLRLLTVAQAWKKTNGASRRVARPTRAPAGDRAIFSSGAKLLGARGPFDFAVSPGALQLC